MRRRHRDKLAPTANRWMLWAALGTTSLSVISLDVRAAADDVIVVDEKTHKGTVQNIDKGRTMTWRAWFDVPPERVHAALTSWETSTKLFKDVLSVSVIEQTAQRAVFRIERKSPAFFIPNQEITFLGTLTNVDAQTSRLDWVLVEGLPKKLTRTWTFTSQDGGVWVEARTEIVLPFEPPAVFVRDDPKEDLALDVERFRSLIGATSAHASSKPASVVPSTTLGVP